MNILEIIIIIISILFILFLIYIFFYGDNIFELISTSNFNNIYTKINTDITEFVENQNPNYKLVFATNNIIFKSYSPLYIDSFHNSTVLSKNTIREILDMDRDRLKLLTIFSNLNKNFVFKKM